MRETVGPALPLRYPSALNAAREELPAKSFFRKRTGRMNMPTKKLTNAITGIVAALLLTSCASPLFGQTSEWAVKMFSEMGTERMHNFGSVALHADVEKRFPFKNIYKEDVVISSVSSNCGCTKASVTKQVVRPGEIGEVVARVDTSGREHTKQRRATIRVVFSKPTVAEVQLQVKTYIRPDVGFEPGVIEFGTVKHGEKVVKKAYLQYAGRSDWALIGIQKNNPGVRAEAREVRRQNGGVVYEILVELKPEASAGYIHDLLKFQTNEPDPATSSIFLPIEGLVVEPLTAKPSFLQLGVVALGQKITRNIVVTGSEPFNILEVSSDDPRITSAKTDLKRTVHVLPVTFAADDATGSISGQIKIVTSLKEDNGKRQTLVVSTTGVVLNKNNTPSSQKKEESSHSRTEADGETEHSRKNVEENGYDLEALEPAPLSVTSLPGEESKPHFQKLDQKLEGEEYPETTAGELKKGTKTNVNVEGKFGWQPVKTMDAMSRGFAKKDPNVSGTGEWVSNWTNALDAREKKFISQAPSCDVRR